MILSFIVYGGMLLIMTYCGYKVAFADEKCFSLKSFCTNGYVFCAIFIFCLVASLRWRVGMDCNSYIRLFYHPQESFEVGFNKLIEWVKYTGANHVPYLFILAFLEIFFFYYAFKWEKIYYLFIPFVLFCSSEYFMMMNGIRQTIACCVFVYVSTQCDKGDILKNMLLVVACSFLHRSSLVLIPIIFIFSFLHVQVRLNRYLQMLLVVLAFIFSSMDLVNIIRPYIIVLLNIIGYGTTENDLLNLSLERTIGPRAYVDLCIYLIIIYFSPLLKENSGLKSFSVQYLLFLIGTIGGYLFYNVHAMVRLLMYFDIFKIVMMIYLMKLMFIDKPLTMPKYYLRLIFVILLCVRSFVEFYADNNPKKETTSYKFYFNHLQK